MAAGARQTLTALFAAAVHAAHPDGCLGAHLPPVPKHGRLIITGAGKAGAAMAAAAERHYRGRGELAAITGALTAPHGYAETLGDRAPTVLEIVAGRHPTPDDGSVAAATRALALSRSATRNDLVLVLLSGGASALWAAPVDGVSLADKTALTRGLLKCGADIHEMNTVRRHLSRIKGGRLVQAANDAAVLTLAISDVPGDDPATIGSGPTVPDPTTLADARAVLARRKPRMDALGLPIPPSILNALDDARNETAKPGDPAFARSEYRIIATPKAALQAAADAARAAGYDVVNLGDTITGEARDVASAHAKLALDAMASGRRVAILSGGELEVTVRSRGGRGGRSQEYALALAVALGGKRGISALAADTDGIDGGEGVTADPAGAVIHDMTLSRASQRHLDAKKFLDENNATPFFAALEDLIVTGPTHTNVNDFRAILIDP